MDKIIKQKHNRWRKKRKTEINCLEQKKKSLSSYKEAAIIFLAKDLPFDIEAIECFVDKNVDITQKNAYAIVKVVSLIQKEEKKTS